MMIVVTKKDLSDFEQDEDYSNTKAHSGSELVPITDMETGNLLTDWYEGGEMDEDPQDLDGDDEEEDKLKTMSEDEENWSGSDNE